MASLRPMSNGDPLTAAPSAPLVALMGKTLTLAPAPLSSTATRNLGVVGKCVLSPHPIKVQASSSAAASVRRVFIIEFLLDFGIVELLLKHSPADDHEPGRLFQGAKNKFARE